MHLIAEIIISALLVVSGFFALVGSYGLIRLPDTMTRLHAPTKASTLGLGGVLLASMTYMWFARGDLSWHELLITLFIFLTAPVTANFLAKAHMHSAERPENMPATGTESLWATFEAPDQHLSPNLTETKPETTLTER